MMHKRRSAKPLFTGSNPVAASSKNKRAVSKYAAYGPFFVPERIYLVSVMAT